MRRFPVGPLITLITLAVVSIVLGNLLSVDARGRVIDDWNETPIEGAQIRLGSRQAVTDKDGNFVFGFLPRGAVLNIRATTYRAVDVPAETVSEVRMQPGTLNLSVVNEQTNSGVKNPEVRKDATLLGTGTEAGDMALPHPGRDEPFLVCAQQYTPKEVRTTLTRLTVKLTPNEAGACPTPTPSPSPSPTPAPSPTTSPSPSPAPSPTRSP